MAMRGILVAVACALWVAWPAASAHAAEDVGTTTVSVDDAQELRAKAKTLAVTGYSFVSIGGAFMTLAAGTIPAFIMGPWELWVVHWASWVTWEVCFFIGVPLLLSAYIKSRLASGLKGNDRLSITGWVFYALTGSLFITAHTAILFPWVFLGPAIATSLAAVIISIAAARRGMIMSGKAQEVESRPVQLFPAISAIPGGFVAGIGGTF